MDARNWRDPTRSTRAEVEDPKVHRGPRHGEGSSTLRYWPCWIVLVLICLLIIVTFVGVWLVLHDTKEIKKEMKEDCDPFARRKREREKGYGGGNSVFGSTGEIDLSLKTHDYAGVMRLLRNLCDSKRCKDSPTCKNELCPWLDDLSSTAEFSAASSSLARRSLGAEDEVVPSETGAVRGFRPVVLNRFRLDERNHPELRNNVWSDDPMLTYDDEPDVSGVLDRRELRRDFDDDLLIGCFETSERVAGLFRRCLPLFVDVCYVASDPRLVAFCRLAASRVLA